MAAFIELIIVGFVQLVVRRVMRIDSKIDQMVKAGLLVITMVYTYIVCWLGKNKSHIYSWLIRSSYVEIGI